AHRRQRDRRHHRDGQAQGEICERRPGAFPEPVRERPHAPRDPQRRAHHPERGASARQPGQLRLRRQGRQHGERTAGEARPFRRRARRRGIGPYRGRARGGRRHGPSAGGRQGPGRRPAVNPSRLFILRPVATSLAMVAIVLAGLLAFRQLPLSALPEVDYPTILVVTFYPGASPEVMTSSVTAPLERQFGQMPGLRQMSSTSSGGAWVITLHFTLELGLDVAEKGVQAAINAGSTLLPSDLPAPPVYSKVNPADAP